MRLVSVRCDTRVRGSRYDPGLSGNENSEQHQFLQKVFEKKEKII